jgi:dCTP deaminase
VQGTAGLFDPGWRGRATLELSNLGVMPVALYPGMRICSFTFEQLSSRVEVPYYKKIGNKYAGQDRPVASRLASETSR